MSILIRLASVEDIEVIFDIRTSVKENHLSREELHALGIDENTIIDLIQSAPCVWVAELENKVSGFAIADAKEGSLFAMFVNPESEGMGLGKALLKAAEAFLFQNFAQIWLETDQSSRALEKREL